MNYRFMIKSLYLSEKQIYIECMNNMIEYSYEYICPSSSIVMTPLTDRCFVALLNTFQQNKVACIYGDRNTGKSSTIKELSKVSGFFSL